MTCEELAEEIATMCGIQAAIKYEPLPQDDPKQRQPDITRAKSLLGWNPTIALHEGLERTIAYFRERLEKPKSKATEG